jgi:endonuclease/exonuclease/phosphatase family metal-dependent hydrolase
VVTVRVVTWNVRGLRDDVAVAVDVVRALRPDVLCLQEAPRFHGWHRRLDGFAEAAGLRLVAGGGGGGHGTALLAAPRATVVGVRPPRHGGPFGRLPAGTLPLSHDRGLHHRAAAVARLRVPGEARVDVTVAAVHLGLQQEQRLRHVDELLAALPLADATAAVVVAGDLNETADRPAWRRLAGRLTDLGSGGAPTFPARRPRHRIDTILAAGPVRAAGRADVPGPPLADRVPLATDHLPVVVDLAIGSRGD